MTNKAKALAKQLEERFQDNQSTLYGEALVEDAFFMLRSQAKTIRKQQKLINRYERIMREASQRNHPAGKGIKFDPDLMFKPSDTTHLDVMVLGEPVMGTSRWASGDSDLNLLAGQLIDAQYRLPVTGEPDLTTGTDSIVHRCPISSSNTTPCCNRTPWELLDGRMTVDPNLVTCKG
jgi:hypothetical protein